VRGTTSEILTEDHQERITGEGAILGTLKHMAPWHTSQWEAARLLLRDTGKGGAVVHTLSVNLNPSSPSPQADDPRLRSPRRRRGDTLEPGAEYHGSIRQVSSGACGKVSPGAAGAKACGVPRVVAGSGLCVSAGAR
jgi:hypothetical protein